MGAALHKALRLRYAYIRTRGDRKIFNAVVARKHMTIFYLKIIKKHQQIKVRFGERDIKRKRERERKECNKICLAAEILRVLF